MENILTLFELHKKRFVGRNTVNNIQDVNNIKYLVATFPKCGTMTLSTSLQQNEDKTIHFKNVVHCHSEECWFAFHKYLRGTGFKLKHLIEISNHNNIKPIVFQLYREPLGRAISNYITENNNKFRNYINNKETFTEKYIIKYLINISNNCGMLKLSEYYEKTFDFSFNDNIFNKTDGYGIINKDNYYIFFTLLDNFDRLNKNLNKAFSNNTQFNFLNFKVNNQNVKTNNVNYNNILDNISLPVTLLNKIFDSEEKLLKFFYTSEDILNIKNKYINGEKIVKIISDDQFVHKWFPEINNLNEYKITNSIEKFSDIEVVFHFLTNN